MSLVEPRAAARDPFARPPRHPARARVSFEVFPPKTPEMEAALWGCIARLAPLDPTFVSVTYGAGGGTRERTHGVVRRMIEETQLSPAAHLTCVDASREAVDAVVRDYWHAGVRHIVALRGDPPGGVGGAYAPHPGGYANATELTAGVQAIAPFEVSVSCYPEKHPESPSLDFDIAVLKAKVDAGASRAISQFFFDVDAFLRFVERARAAGVTIPIVPGIMPVSNLAGTARMAAACGTAIPEALARRFEGLEDDARGRRAVAVDVAAETAGRLVSEGFADLHLYTLNKADVVHEVCERLGLRDAAVEEASAK